MTDTVAEMNQVMAEADCLVNDQQVSTAIDNMAKEITDRLKDSNPLLFCVMNGGLILTGQLLPRLRRAHTPEGLGRRQDSHRKFQRSRRSQKTGSRCKQRRAKWRQAASA